MRKKSSPGAGKPLHVELHPRGVESVVTRRLTVESRVEFEEPILERAVGFEVNERGTVAGSPPSVKRAKERRGVEALHEHFLAQRFEVLVLSRDESARILKIGHVNRICAVDERENVLGGIHGSIVYALRLSRNATMFSVVWGVLL